MRKYSSIVLIIIGLFCTIGLLAYFLTSNRAEMDVAVRDSDSASRFEGKLVNKDQRDATLESSLESNFNNKPKGFESDSDTLNSKDNMDSGNIVDTGIVSKGGEDKNTPLYNDGNPGISRAELYDMHEYQLAQRERERNNPDAIVIEATESQPAITRGELEAMHAEQLRQMQEERNDRNAIVFEATENQPAMTRGELQDLHAEQRRQIQDDLNNPDSIAIEATDGHPAMTRGEIEALHREQLRQMWQEANNPDAPALEFEDGTMITNQELAELHDKQMYQFFASQFNGNEIVIEETE